MDIFSTAAGAFALATQLFQPTLALYSAYSESKEYIHVLDLQVQLRVECIRYETWGEYMGLNDEKAAGNITAAGHSNAASAMPEHRLHVWWKTHPSHLDLVISILSLVSQRLMQLEEFQRKYDRLIEVPALAHPISSQATGNILTNPITSSKHEVDLKSINSPNDLIALITARIAQQEQLTAERKSLSRRLSNFTFGLRGKGKFESLISDLRRCNDNLENITGYQTPLRGRLFSRLLDSSTEPVNRQLQDLIELGSATAVVQPMLAEMARRKAVFLRLKEQATEGLALNSTLTHDPDTSLAYSALNDRTRNVSGRDFARYNGLPVMLEWKSLNVDLPRDECVRQIRDLTRFLSNHCVSAHPDETSGLHLLNCLGYLQEPGKSDTMALVYSIDAPCVSLSEMLQKLHNYEERNFNLGTRFRLARQLAECVFYLHLIGWLHKGINSENVLILGDQGLLRESQNLNLFLAGFSMARLDGHSSQKFEFNEQTDLYHHPNYQGRNRQFSLYSRKYDIYSFGLVLLELGAWEPLHKLGRYDAQKHNPEKFHARLTHKQGPAQYLTFRTGNEFKKAVLWCLEDQMTTLASISDEERSQAFWDQVVMRLANIQLPE